MATIDKAYNEYKNIVKDLESESKETLYEKLMSKESNILGLIGRIANEKNSGVFQNTIFYEKSLFEVTMLFANTWKQIIHEVFVEKKSIAVFWNEIFYMGDRKIYTGMMLVLIAILILCVQASAGT